MKCPRCYCNTPADAAFCLECGTELSIVCIQCAANNASDHKYCRECGHRLAPVGQLQLPEYYIPKYLAEKIRTARCGLGEERKHVTVLFADIKGSLELIADRDPEDASKILDAVLRLMIDAVHRYEGTVNRVMGDGIMALFGAPVALEDHSLRACYTALMLQDRVKQYSEEIRRIEGLHIQLRIGVNTGEVIIRSINSDLQMDYAAVGETTHLAARMEQMAIPGSTLITAEVKRRVDGYLDVRPLGYLPVKGLRTPIEVFELIGEAAITSRLQVAAARGLTCFSGRVDEMHLLREALKRTEAGQGQIIGVEGDAGIGKSRLLYELVHSSYTHHWLVLEFNSISYGRTAPYFPIINSLKGYFRIAGRDDQQDVQRKVTSKIFQLDQSLQNVIPSVLYLLETLPREHAFNGLDPAQRRELIGLSIKRLILAESDRQPVVLLFEDVHWSDSLTLGILQGLVDELARRRVLLLFSRRPGGQYIQTSAPHFQCLRLNPLPRETVEELLVALLGADLALTALKEYLIAQTEGNPFFLEEIIQNLFETGVLIGDRGHCKLVNPVSTLQVAPKVQSVIASRIDRLTPQEKRLLLEASVIGKEVPFALLAAITEFSDDELRGLLENLRAAEFLYEAKLFPEMEFTFKHSLTQEVAYASLLHDHRREIHALILETLEQVYSTHVNEYVEQLAHHAYQGQLWAKAVTYLRQAATKAVERLINKDAVALFERALDALMKLQEDRGVIEQAIDIRFDIRNALQPLGDLGHISKVLQEAEKLAAQINDQRRIGLVAAYLAEHFRMLGDPKAAEEAGQRALAIAKQHRDLPLYVVANLPMGLLYHATGEYSRAIELLQWNVLHLEDEFLSQRFGLFGLPSVLSRCFLAWCFAEIGDFKRGVTVGNEGLRIAERSDHPFSMMYAHLGTGVLYVRRGDIDRAIPILERALECGTFSQIPVGVSYGASYLGYALMLAGRAAEALPLLERTTSPAIARRFVARHSLRVAYLGEAYLQIGQIKAATSAAAQSLELARNHGERGHEAYALRLLGQVMTQRDEPLLAENHLLGALDLAKELGMCPLAAQCHWSLARLFGTRDRVSAHRHLGSARSMFRDLEMTGWLQRLEIEFSSA
jgi:class 3 adenylate cyclase/tetratricopeptide (TPR) repeat protein